MAIGIGMCCAVRSEIGAIVGPPPGVRDPAALATFRWGLVSYPSFERYREQRLVVAAGAAVLGPVPFAVAFGGARTAVAERFNGHVVSPGYFSTLGATPAMGRFFSPETEKPGMPPVVVVSDRFWRAHLGADPDAVGRTLRLNGREATIVGIGREDFLGIWPGNPADLFVPATCNLISIPELGSDPLHNTGREIFRPVFRLAPGVTLPGAEAAFNATARNLDRERGIRRENGWRLRLMPAGTVMYATPEQRKFTITFEAVLWALVMALLCANLANLLLARGGERRKEIAVRLSVGASRPRLVRQLLTESVLLSLVGGAGGVLMAYGFSSVLSSLPVPAATPIELHCHIDLRALAWTLAVAVAAGIGFGLAPALTSARIDMGATLKQGAQAPLRGYGRLGLRNVFVMGQMAASLMLVFVTGLVATAFLLITRVNPGFDVTNLSLVSLDPVRDGNSVEETAALLIALPGELSLSEGVRAVSLSGTAPFGWLSAEQADTPVSVPESGGQTLRTVYREHIGEEYFATVGVPLLAGREFDRRDLREAVERGAAVPAVLNRTAAVSLFGPNDPIGRRIRQGDRNYTVVGLVRDMQAGSLSTRAVATMFVPLTARTLRENPGRGATVLARGAPGGDTLAAVRSRLASLHPGLTIFNARTLEEDLGRLNAFFEWQSTLFVTLGVFSLLLACLGLGGVTAHAVARRRKEIGIRMALGARAGQVQALVLREGAALLTAGSAIGFAGAFGLDRALAANNEMLARTIDQPVNAPLLLVGAPLALAGLAMLACYLPARRATAIDPAVALREE